MLQKFKSTLCTEFFDKKTQKAKKKKLQRLNYSGKKKKHTFKASFQSGITSKAIKTRFDGQKSQKMDNFPNKKKKKIGEFLKSEFSKIKIGLIS